MTQKEFDAILKRYLSDKCTDKEIMFVEEWFENVKREELFFSSENEKQVRDKVWTSLMYEIQPVYEKKASGFWQIGKIAASIILVVSSVVVISSFFQDKFSTSSKMVVGDSSSEKMFVFTNTENVIREIKLKDGSSVLVHPGSKISYPKVFGTNREVHLTGEAFFEIVKDPAHPFLVYANEITTMVLGTSFSIKAYEEQKEIVVAVTTGKVSVFSKSREYQSKRLEQEVTLTPNQQVIYNRSEDKVEKKLVEFPKVLNPDSSIELVYTDESVVKIFIALEKMYGIPIRYDKDVLSNCNITTEVSDEGLLEQIELICNALSAKYEINDAVITIVSNGCD